MSSFWDLSDEDKRLYNEHYSTVAEECEICGTWVSVDDIDFGSSVYCNDCQSSLFCDDCGASISAFDYTQTGLCVDCANREHDDYDEHDDDYDEFAF